LENKRAWALYSIVRGALVARLTIMKIIASATIALAAVTAANTADMPLNARKAPPRSSALVRNCDRVGTASYSAGAKAGARRICIVNLMKAAEALRA
jgi:hypothetical protein